MADPANLPSNAAGADSKEAALPVKTTPKDALVMASILKEMGVTEYEPRVVNQMVEFAYRYVTDVIEDARAYSQHSNRKNISLDDVKLAVSQRLDHSFTSPPPREFLLEVARKKNAQPLPTPPDKLGLRLPPERYCLTAQNYRIKPTSNKSSGKQSAQRKQANSAANKTAAAAAAAATGAATATATGNKMAPANARVAGGQQVQMMHSPKGVVTAMMHSPTAAGQMKPNNAAQVSAAAAQVKNEFVSTSAAALKRKREPDEDDDYDA